MNTLRLPTIEQSMDQLMQQAGQNFAVDDTPGRRSDVLRHLRHIAANELPGRFTENAFRHWLADIAQMNWNTQIQELLIPAFTVGETYFRRDPGARTYLQQQFLPQFLRKHPNKLSIWSAGCCTGEESYDIAILATESVQNFSPDTQVNVIGTDLNEAFIQQARKGIYRQTSFRGSDSQYRRSWFVQTNDSEWQINPVIARRVAFEKLNLNRQPAPKAGNQFDIILCRNVLMYFQPEAAYQVLRNFMSALGPDGVMLIGAVEASLVTEAGYKGVWAGDNFALFKQNNQHSDNPGRTPSTTTKSGGVAVSGNEDIRDSSRSTKAQTTPVTPLKRYIKPTRKIAERPAVEHTLEEAMHEFQKKNYPAAIHGFLNVLGLPEVSQQQKVTAMKKIARAYLSLNNSDEAMSWVTEALQIAPRDAELFVLLTQIYEHYNLLEDALSCADKAIYLEPDLCLAFFLKASLHHKLRQFPQARKAWKNCTELSTREGNTEVKFGDGLNHNQLASLSAQLLNEADRHDA